MSIVEKNPYADFKYGQCVRNDRPFQDKIMWEEKYDKGFSEDCNDLFQSLYQKDVKFNGEGRIKTLLDSIKDSNDFKQLKERTKGNHVLAYIAMKDMIPQLQQIAKELPKDNKPQDQKSKDRIRQGMRLAVQEAADTVEEAEGMIDVLGIGKEGGITTDEDVGSAIESANRFANDEVFKRIMEMAGRFERQADSQIKTNCSHGLDELVGIDSSDDIANVLPEELADDDLFNLNFVESKLQVNKFRGKEPKEKGAKIVCIDRSGSMDGWRYEFSSAILFAMYLVAKQDELPMFVNLFDVNVISREIKSTKDIMWIMGKYMGGGTDFNLPLTRSFEQIESNPEFEKADIVFITDGFDTLSEDVMNKIQSTKKRISLKIISLLIGRGSTETLKGFSDKVFQCWNEASSKEFCEEVFTV